MSTISSRGLPVSKAQAAAIAAVRSYDIKELCASFKQNGDISLILPKECIMVTKASLDAIGPIPKVTVATAVIPGLKRSSRSFKEEPITNPSIGCEIPEEDLESHVKSKFECDDFSGPSVFDDKVMDPSFFQNWFKR